MKKYHIIGGGLSGLCKAYFLLKKGVRGENIKIYEASANVGGRCYSFYDKKLDRIVDVGTHLIIGANWRTIKLLWSVKALKNFKKVKPVKYPIFDIENNDFFELTTSINSLNKLKNKSVLSLLCESIFNVSKEEINTKLFNKNLFRAFILGKFSMQPYLARNNLYDDLIKPLLEYLLKKDVEINLGQKLSKIRIEKNRICELKFDKNIDVKNDEIIFAISPDNLANLIPELKEKLPKEFSSIINIHYRTSMRISLPAERTFMGVINGFCHWIFVKNDVLSVTISNADKYIDMSDDEIARKAWAEVCKIRGREAPFIPNYRVIKSKKATTKKIGIKKHNYNIYKNIKIIGDWSVGDYPNSIEASIINAKRN